MKSKTAWLVGVYTPHIDDSIERLGYKLTRFYPEMNCMETGDENPGMIVFSEDRFSDTDAMFYLKDVFPDVVMITLPAVEARQLAEGQDISDHAIRCSLSRLISFIQHREHRWDN